MIRTCPHIRPRHVQKHHPSTPHTHAYIHIHTARPPIHSSAPFPLPPFPLKHLHSPLLPPLRPQPAVLFFLADSLARRLANPHLPLPRPQPLRRSTLTLLLLSSSPPSPPLPGPVPTAPPPRARFDPRCRRCLGHRAWAARAAAKTTCQRCVRANCPAPCCPSRASVDGWQTSCIIEPCAYRWPPVRLQCTRCRGNSYDVWPRG